MKIFSIMMSNEVIGLLKLRFTPVFCSVMGAVAKGTVFMSNGFSEGSSVYWWRDFSSPGTDTDRPAKKPFNNPCSLTSAKSNQIQ